MSHPAQQARENAIVLELKKDGLQQRQNGDWVLRFTVAAIDMDQRIAAASMGTRYQAAIVEIGDDERPIDYVAMDRDKWRALGPARQAGIRCKDAIFWAFLREQGINDVKYPEARNEERAAAIVRNLCNVLTRSDLGKPAFSDQRLLWYDVDTKFQAWKAREHG